MTTLLDTGSSQGSFCPCFQHVNSPMTLSYPIPYPYLIASLLSRFFTLLSYRCFMNAVHHLDHARRGERTEVGSFTSTDAGATVRVAGDVGPRNCTKTGATSRTRLSHPPSEERGQTSREAPAPNSCLLRGFEGRERVAVVPIGSGLGEVGKSWPGRAGGGGFLKGLYPELVQDAGCGQARICFVAGVYFLRM